MFLSRSGNRIMEWIFFWEEAIVRINENTRKMQVTCNCCGKKIETAKGIVIEGALSINVDWGYFSEKDGDIHRFDICEKCYDQWIASFKIPIEVVRKTEML